MLVEDRVANQVRGAARGPADRQPDRNPAVIQPQDGHVHNLELTSRHLDRIPRQFLLQDAGQDIPADPALGEQRQPLTGGAAFEGGDLAQLRGRPGPTDHPRVGRDAHGRMQRGALVAHLVEADRRGIHHQPEAVLQAHRRPQERPDVVHPAPEIELRELGIHLVEFRVQHPAHRLQHPFRHVDLRKGDHALVAGFLREWHDLRDAAACPEPPLRGRRDRGAHGDPDPRWRVVQAAGTGDGGQDRGVVPAAAPVGHHRRERGRGAVQLKPEWRPLGAECVVQPVIAGRFPALLDVTHPQRKGFLQPGERRAEVVFHRDVDMGGGQGQGRVHGQRARGHRQGSVELVIGLTASQGGQEPGPDENVSHDLTLRAAASGRKAPRI